MKLPPGVTPRILIVVADRRYGFRPGRLAGWDVVVTRSGVEALVLMAHSSFTVLLADADLPGRGGAGHVLVRAAIDRPGVVRWMMGARKPKTYDQLFARGEVEGFMRHPFELEDFLARLSGKGAEPAAPESAWWRLSVPLRRLARAFLGTWRRRLLPPRTPIASRAPYLTTPRSGAELAPLKAMPPMSESPLESILAGVRDVVERVRDPLATARIDVVSAQALLAPPSTMEQTALAIAMLGNARAAVDRIHAVIAHLVQSFAQVPGEELEVFQAGWGERVLVVDDHDAVRGAVGRMLADHDIVLLASPHEALDRIAAGERFAFILSDLMMAEMTGDLFFEELARLAPEQAERFLFMSGGALSDAAREGMRRAARPVISKPFKPLLLHRLLAGLASAPSMAARP